MLIAFGEVREASPMLIVSLTGGERATLAEGRALQQPALVNQPISSVTIIGEEDAAATAWLIDIARRNGCPSIRLNREVPTFGATRQEVEGAIDHDRANASADEAARLQYRIERALGYLEAYSDLPGVALAMGELRGGKAAEGRESEG